MSRPRATTAQIVFYAAPGMAPALINLPAAVILPTLYVENTTVTLAAIGLVNLLRWWFDAVTDPLVGYLSDRTVNRWGGRRAWVVMGALFSATAAFFLFQPAPDSGTGYYAVSLLGVYLGFTCFTIAHQAWGSEIAADYHDRSRITTFYSLFTILGSLAIWLMPLVLYPMTGTLEITPTVMIGLAWLILIVLPGSAGLAALYVPAGARMSVEKPSLGVIARGIRGNKPLWRYIAAVAIWGIGQGIELSVLFIFLRDYMLLGDRFPILMIAFFAAQTLSMPFWRWAMGRWGKHRPWAASWAVSALSAPLVLLLEPGAGSFAFVLPLIVLRAFINGGSYIGPVALLGDIADYGILKTGVNSTGNLFAFKSLIEKANFGIGTGIAFPLLALFGYQIGASNDAVANLGLLILYLGIPCVTALVAAAILWNFPLDERRHGIIRRRLELLADRRERGEPAATL
jgi:glycoside/pentoside/hexuronide:cation symporter, GPH family